MTDENQKNTTPTEEPSEENKNPSATNGDNPSSPIQDEKDSDLQDENEEKDEKSPEDDEEKEEKKKLTASASDDEGEADFRQMTEQEFQEKTKEMVLPTLLKFFRPELINRFDDVIFFHPLRKQDLKNIVDIMLQEPREMLREKNIEFRLSEGAKLFLADKGYNPAFGARPLRRAIQQYLEDPLSDHLIAGDFVKGDSIFIDINEAKDALVFQKDVPNEKSNDELDPFAKLENHEEVEPENKTPEENATEEDTGENANEETPENDAVSSDRQEPTEIPNGEESGEKKSFFKKVFQK